MSTSFVATNKSDFIYNTSQYIRMVEMSSLHLRPGRHTDFIVDVSNLFNYIIINKEYVFCSCKLSVNIAGKIQDMNNSNIIGHLGPIYYRKLFFHSSFPVPTKQNILLYSNKKLPSCIRHNNKTSCNVCGRRTYENLVKKRTYTNTTEDIKTVTNYNICYLCYNIKHNNTELYYIIDIIYDYANNTSNDDNTIDL